MTRPQPGSTCCYCKRVLLPTQPERDLSFTFDHVKCQASGGFRKVPCCRKCNSLKDDIAVGDWFWFIDAHPRWWKEFRFTSQVKRVVMEYKRMLATARAASA